MGSQAVKAITNSEKRRQFNYQVLKDLEALELLIKTGTFEKGVQRLGVEQELCIVDKFFRPSFNALKILDKINDSHFTTELGLFNIEANLDPIEIENKCFSSLEKEIYKFIDKARIAADSIENNKIILAGILPTIKRKDLVFENMTPLKRYSVLNDVMKKIRGDNFRVQVRGIDELILDHESIMFEACNTSFQVHLQINLDDIIDQYNWSQAISGPVLSVMTNSSLLLGRELWSETRIALLQQSLDLRSKSHLLREQKPRVSFGNDWVKDSILELYTNDIARYAPLITTTFESDAIQDLKNGMTPELKALNLHSGTLYKWNRLCYGIKNNIAHLRIENRYIPAGPSVKDEIANAMLWIGVMLGMPEDCRNIHKRMAFKDARGNFIKAARTGMDTYFNWFGKGMSAKELALEILLPMARKGLLKAHIDPMDIKLYLGIIEQRIKKDSTGSKWLVRSSRKLRESVSREEANIVLTHHLYKNQMKGQCVSDWELAESVDQGATYSQNKVYKIMSTEVFTVDENDSIYLIKSIMQWKNIHHLPVVNEDNRIVGIISHSHISREDIDDKDSAKDIMVKEIITTSPETKIEKAEEIMMENKIGCLPIIDQGELVGMLTKTDLKKQN